MPIDVADDRGEPVAVKVLRLVRGLERGIPPDAIDAETRIHRLLTDAPASEQHVVPLRWACHGLSRGYEFAFLVMPIMEQTLENWMANAANRWVPDIGDAVQIRHLCRALTQCIAALAAAGVVHGDIKPDNLFVETRGEEVQVRAGDIGSARLMTDEEVGRLGVVHTRVRAAPGDLRQMCEVVNMGAPLYMAPEQLANNRYGAATVSADVYACGVLLWLITRHRADHNDLEDIFSRLQRTFLTAHARGNVAAASDYVRALLPEHYRAVASVYHNEVVADAVLAALRGCSDPDPRRRISAQDLAGVLSLAAELTMHQQAHAALGGAAAMPDAAAQ